MPVLNKLRNWLDDNLPKVPLQSLTGKALHYLNNEWPELICYLQDGRLEIDNNLAENAVRSSVRGRKNWLALFGPGTWRESNANPDSLIETVKANGLEPYRYLRTAFTELPQAETIEAIEQLLPGMIKLE